jgi:hypothetical protein
VRLRIDAPHSHLPRTSGKTIYTPPLGANCRLTHLDGREGRD